jgi:predicted acetyltransferase
MNMELRELNPNHEQAFLDGLMEWQGEDPHWYSFIWKEGMPFFEMLTILQKEAKGIDLSPGRVPHTMLYGFLNGVIIGRVSVRHTLNEYLRKRGGHIGYAIAPTFRRKGYATILTGQALDYCKNINIRNVMITCADDNEPSWKIIEHFSGKLEDKIWDDEDNEMIRRYWISLG